MHSYFTTGTFGSNLSKFTNEISLMGLYKTLFNILHLTSSSPPICFHGADLVLSTKNFSSTQHLNNSGLGYINSFSQVSIKNKDTIHLIFTFFLSMKKVLTEKVLYNLSNTQSRK